MGMDPLFKIFRGKRHPISAGSIAYNRVSPHKTLSDVHAAWSYLCMTGQHIKANLED